MPALITLAHTRAHGARGIAWSSQTELSAHLRHSFCNLPHVMSTRKPLEPKRCILSGTGICCLSGWRKDLQHQSLPHGQLAQSRGQQLRVRGAFPTVLGQSFTTPPPGGVARTPGSAATLGLGQVQHLPVESVGLPSQTALFPFSQAGQRGREQQTAELPVYFKRAWGCFPSLPPPAL